MKLFRKIGINFGFDVMLFLLLVFILVAQYVNFLPEQFGKIIIVIIAYFATLPVFWSAIKTLRHGKISIDLLASIALGFSLFEQQWPSVIFINLMIASARIFSDYTKNKSRSAIEGLFKLQPHKVKIIKNGVFKEEAISKIKKGDLVLIELGEIIPADGVVIKGEAEINQSSLTGESLPVARKKGDKVFSSTIVVSGNLIVQTEKISEETMFSKFIKLVKKSSEYKAPISSLSEKFSTCYIILILLGSATLFFFTRNVSLVLAVLLVSCADDVAAAIPLAFSVSIARSAKKGVIIKRGDFLEALSGLKAVVMDKTGTLTRGHLKIEGIFTFESRRREEVMKLAGVLSLMSNHPSAVAINQYVKEKNIFIREPQKFQEYIGRGAVAMHEYSKIISGKLSFLQEFGVKFTERQLENINSEKEKGFSLTLIGENDHPVGFIALADDLRPRAKETVSALNDLGIVKVVMLTGDNEKIAKRVSDLVGIKEFHANLLPDDKLKYLRKYLSPRYKTAMVGDGVNDAAGLSLANIGIAMGAIGSDAAIESADIVLMKDDLTQVPKLVEAGRATMKVVRQDLWIWAIINAVGLILVFTKILNPSSAAAYNFLTDFFPLINSLRLFK